MPPPNLVSTVRDNARVSPPAREPGRTVSAHRDRPRSSAPRPAPLTVHEARAAGRRRPAGAPAEPGQSRTCALRVAEKTRAAPAPCGVPHGPRPGPWPLLPQSPVPMAGIRSRGRRSPAFTLARTPCATGARPLRALLAPTCRRPGRRVQPAWRHPPRHCHVSRPRTRARIPDQTGHTAGSSVHERCGVALIGQNAEASPAAEPHELGRNRAIATGPQLHWP